MTTHRRIHAVWGKQDGHIYSLVNGDEIQEGDLIFPILNNKTSYPVLKVFLRDKVPPYTAVDVFVKTAYGKDEFSLDRRREYVCIRKADIAPSNARALTF